MSLENENTEIVENDLQNDDVELDEAAADTLKPGAGSAGGDQGYTKTEAMAAVMKALGGMSTEDINKFAETQGLFGKGKAPGAEDKSAQNKSSISTKPSAASSAVKEDVEGLFEGEELSEEFKEKTATLFEAAVALHVNMEKAKLEEEYEVKLQEELEQVREDITSKLDQYLDYVIEQWIDENQIAIEKSLRADIAEGFIEGLHKLFLESHINVPEESLDVVGQLSAQIEELETKLNESIDRQLELQTVVDEATKEAIFDEVTEGLVATQVEKLRALAEGIEYTDEETYTRKLEIVKENFLGKKTTTSTGVVADEGGEPLNEDVAVPAHMAKYMRAISKTTK